MEYALSALADTSLITKNFHGKPTKRHLGITWAANEAIADGDESIKAIRTYLESLSVSPPTHGERYPPVAPPLDTPAPAEKSESNPENKY